MAVYKARIGVDKSVARVPGTKRFYLCTVRSKSLRPHQKSGDFSSKKHSKLYNEKELLLHSHPLCENSYIPSVPTLVSLYLTT